MQHTRLGAEIVFADINPLTGNLDPKSVESKITDDTSAILTVDWGGYPSDLDELFNIARRYKIEVIQDAAHSLGAIYKGRYVGSGQVDFTCFSTQATKNLSTVDGGILCCLDKQDSIRARKLKWFGVDKENSPEGELGEREYILDEIGFKMNPNNLLCAIGLGNLVGFKECLARRRAIANYYTELANVAGLQLMKYEPDRESSYWLFPLRVQNRLGFVRALKAKGIPTSVVHQRIDKHPLFGGINEDLVGMAIFDREQIHIPIHSELTNDEVDLIVRTIQNGW
jgi:perosamine synthetase